MRKKIKFLFHRISPPVIPLTLADLQTDEILKGNGNATVPQGTQITWQVRTRSTEQVLLYANDTIVFERAQDNGFEGTKRLSSSLDYTISASNDFVSDYETLNLRFSSCRQLGYVFCNRLKCN